MTGPEPSHLDVIQWLGVLIALAAFVGPFLTAVVTNKVSQKWQERMFSAMEKRQSEYESKNAKSHESIRKDQKRIAELLAALVGAHTAIHGPLGRKLYDDDDESGGD